MTETAAVTQQTPAWSDGAKKSAGHGFIRAGDQHANTLRQPVPLLPAGVVGRHGCTGTVAADTDKEIEILVLRHPLAVLQ
jgi:hypothetical protein